LRNSGNTCYINAALQFLTPALFEQSGTIGSELVRLCDEVREEKGVAKTDKLLDLMTSKLHKDHAMYNAFNVQHDAEEFLRALLDLLQTESKTMSKENKNELVTNLGGSLLFRFTCSCGHALHNEQTLFGAYPVNIPSVPEDPTVPDLIRNAMEAEELDDYPCENCKQAGKVKLESNFKQMPRLLMFHLIRNEWNTERGAQKVRTPVRFTETFEWDVGKQKEQFTLLSVLNHQGNEIDRGHYTCYRRRNTGKWLLADDNLTREAQDGEAWKNPTATMLLYQKVEQR